MISAVRLFTRTLIMMTGSNPRMTAKKAMMHIPHPKKKNPAVSGGV